MRSFRDTHTAGSKTGRFGRRARMTTGAIIAAALVGTSAFAQTMPQPKTEQAQTMRPGEGAKGPARFAERDDRRGGHGWNKGRHHRGPGHRGPGRHGPRGGMMMSPAKLAGALAAFETGVGIQPEQMATWRKFTGALMAFAESAQPPRGRPGMGRGPRDMGPDEMAPDDDAADTSDSMDAGAPEENATAQSPADAGPQAEADQKGLFAFKMLDRVADRAIDAGERAKTLKSALADLETTLTPQQIDTARGLIRSMMQDLRQDGRRGRHGRHGEMGPRHDRGPGHGPRFGGRHGGPRGPMDQPGDMRMAPDDQGGPGDDQPADMAPETAPEDAPQQG